MAIRLIKYNLLRLRRARTGPTDPRHLPLFAQLGSNPTRMLRPRHRRRRLRRRFRLLRCRGGRDSCHRTRRTTLPSGITNVCATSRGRFNPSAARHVAAFRGVCRSAHLAREKFGILFGADGVRFRFLDVVGALAVFLFPDSERGSSGQWVVRDEGAGTLTFVVQPGLVYSSARSGSTRPFQLSYPDDHLHPDPSRTSPW